MAKRLRAVCSGYYGFDNFGDEAVLSVLVQTFSEKYDLTVFSANPSKTAKTYGVNSICSFDYLQVINEIKSADVFISGGGSLLQDVTSFKSLIYYLLLLYFAVLFRKRIIIFAQGIGPLNRKLSQMLVKQVMQEAELVTVRDSESLALLRSWGVSATQINDPVYNLSCCSKRVEGKVGIQLRDFSLLSESFLRGLANAVNKYFPDKDIVLYSLQDAIDLEICKKFSALLKSKHVCIKSQMTVEETVAELSSLETLVAMRFHAALIGFKAGVKVLPIVYDKKVRILAEETGVPYLNLNENDFDSQFENLQNLDVETIQTLMKNKKMDEKVFDI